MNIYLLIYFIIVYFIFLNNAEIIDGFDGIIDEEETVYTGKILKYLNITELLEYGKEGSGNEGEGEGEVEVEDEDVSISATTTKKFKENFYNQLNNSGEKEIYQYIFDYCDRMDPVLTFTVTIPKYIDKNKVNMERVMTCLIYDNPRFWWIDENYAISVKNTFEKNGEEYDILTILTVNFSTPESGFHHLSNETIYQMNQAIALETDILLYQIELLNLHTKYEVLQFIHDYVIRNTIYENDGQPYIHTLYGPLVEHKSVCSGYSKVLRHVAAYFGINVIIARSLTHEWNYVSVNDKWYIIDVTWDDPAVAKQIFNDTRQEHDQVLHRPEKGDYTNLSHDYFLIGTEAFQGDEDAIRDHDLIYSYFSLKSLVVYPDIETKNFIRTAENDEYVERLRIETGSTNDTNLNATEDAMDTSGRKNNYSITPLEMMLPLLINIIIVSFIF
eukprot:jgi/Orpsp1_1/1189156/evm.model.d7180000069908.1